MPLILTASGLALCVACLCMPWVERLGMCRGLTTTPAAHKLDQRRLPYLGGVALFFVLAIGLIITLGVDRGHIIQFPTAVFFLLAAGWTAAFGVYDDVHELSPPIKLAAQLVSAGIIVAGGLRTDIFFLSPAANIALSVVWIVTLMNAINLLDIMDGLAGSITVINSGVFFLFGWLSHNFLVMTVSAFLIVGLIPFLRRNLPPARLIMGDAGSQLLGLCQAAMAMSLDMAAAGFELRVFIPFLILAVPLFDLLFVIVMRVTQGKPVFLKSNDHFVFRMRQTGISERAILRRMVLLSVVTNSAAIMIFFLPAAAGLILCIGCVGVMVAVGVRVGRFEVGR